MLLSVSEDLSYNCYLSQGNWTTCCWSRSAIKMLIFWEFFIPRVSASVERFTLGKWRTIWEVDCEKLTNFRAKLLGQIATRISCALLWFENHSWLLFWSHCKACGEKYVTSLELRSNEHPHTNPIKWGAHRYWVSWSMVKSKTYVIIFLVIMFSTMLVQKKFRVYVSTKQKDWQEILHLMLSAECAKTLENLFN